MNFKKVVLFLTMLCFIHSSKGYTKNNDLGKEKVGKATFYDKGFRGKPTARGDVYDPYKLTVATKDRTIPFGTMLEITNVENGKKVVAEVTDRMSSRATKQLDLSVASFNKIGNPKKGVLQVRYKIIKLGNNKLFHKKK